MRKGRTKRTDEDDNEAADGKRLLEEAMASFRGVPASQSSSSAPSPLLSEVAANAVPITSPGLLPDDVLMRDPSALKADGFGATALKAGGFGAKALKAAGFSSKELFASGFDLADLYEAGFIPSDTLYGLCPACGSTNTGDAGDDNHGCWGGYGGGVCDDCDHNW